MHKPKLVLILLFCLFFSSGYVLAKQGEQRAVPLGSSKAPYGFYEYLPQGYDNSNQKFPVVLFFHGSGEKGNGSTSTLPKVLLHGPPKMVKQGKHFPFILISAQSSSNWSTPKIDELIEYVKANYRVDTDRIYLTGLSMGGFGVIGYAGQYADKIAAMVPIASGSTNKAYGCKFAKLPIWAFHNQGDGRVKASNTTTLISNIKACGGSPKMTIYAVNGHDGWTATYNNQQMWDWMLSQKRNGTQKPPNQAPVANAGSAKTITLPTNSVTLKGTASDSDGTIASWAWSKVSGPSSLSMSGQNTATLSVSSLAAGTYVFRLTVKDNENLSATSDVKVVVNPAVSAGNKSPVVNAGSPVTITLPSNSVVLKGSASDSDGSIASWVWSKVSGPGSQKLSGQNTANLTASALVAGSYVFRLTVKDNKGKSASADVKVTVNNKPASNNSAPIANAGTNKVVNLPTSSVTLSGSGIDKDGRIASYSWVQQSGKTATISNATKASCGVSKLAEGEYVFRLEVKDDDGAIGKSWVRVSVKGDNSSSPSKPGTTPPAIATVNYWYYEGTWDYTPNFDALKAKKSGKVNGFDVSPKMRDTNYGFKFETTINVTTAGTYKFFLKSDDGSKLWVNYDQVVNNDGIHFAVEKTGQIKLSKGKHTIKVFFFNKTGDGVLDVAYEGPGQAKTLLSAGQAIAANASEREGNFEELNDELTFNSEIKVYPNPFQQQLNLDLPSDLLDKEVSVTLFNEAGVKIYDNYMRINDTNTLDFSNLRLTNGFYFLKLKSDGFSKDFKLIRQ